MAYDPTKLFARNESLAGQTVYRDGYNITYDKNGYATSGSNVEQLGQTRAPSYDAAISGGNRGDYGGSQYDKQYLSDYELQALDELRQMAANGQISWTEANWEANRVRSQYGYTGGRNGSEFNPMDYTTYMGKSLEDLYGSNYAGNNNASGSSSGSGAQVLKPCVQREVRQCRP